jgi:hypothetical protein
MRAVCQTGGCLNGDAAEQLAVAIDGGGVSPPTPGLSPGAVVVA